jgi:hypothetical protein
LIMVIAREVILDEASSRFIDATALITIIR